MKRHDDVKLKAQQSHGFLFYLSRIIKLGYIITSVFISYFRMSALQNKQKTRKRILPFVSEYRPSMTDLKHSYEQMASSYTKPALTKKNI